MFCDNFHVFEELNELHCTKCSNLHLGLKILKILKILQSLVLGALCDGSL